LINRAADPEGKTKEQLGVSPGAVAYGFPRTERAAPGAGLSAQVAAAEKRRQATAPIPYARAIDCRNPVMTRGE